jgi:small subunit ribosomal protein S16
MPAVKGVGARFHRCFRIARCERTAAGRASKPFLPGEPVPARRVSVFERSHKDMVKIRMMRMGSKKRPYYRVMAIDERKQRDGRPLEFLGTYDPRVEPPAVKLDVESIDGWVAKGAQLSDTVRSLVKGVRQSGATAAVASTDG